MFWPPIAQAHSCTSYQLLTSGISSMPRFYWTLQDPNQCDRSIKTNISQQQIEIQLVYSPFQAYLNLLHRFTISFSFFLVSPNSLSRMARPPPRTLPTLITWDQSFESPATASVFVSTSPFGCRFVFYGDDLHWTQLSDCLST